MKVEKKRGVTLIGSIVILSISILIAASSISNAINDAGFNISNPTINNSHSNGSYELVISEGWLYLYDKENGQVYRKAEHSDEAWETIKHFTE